MKRIYFTLWTSLVIVTTNSQAIYDYIKIFGAPGYEDVRGLVLDKNNRPVFTGLSKTGLDSMGDVYYMNLDEKGEVVKNLWYGKEEEDGGNGIINVSDGGYLITGHTAKAIIGEECDAMITKLNEDGELEWQINLGAELDETCYSAIEMGDKSFWISAVEHIEDSAYYNGVLFHIDKNGQFISKETMVKNSSEYFNKNIIYRITKINDQEIKASGIITSGVFKGENVWSNTLSAAVFTSTFNLDKQGKVLGNHIQVHPVLSGGPEPTGIPFKMYDFINIDKNEFFFGTYNYNYNPKQATDSLNLGLINYSIVSESNKNTNSNTHFLPGMSNGSIMCAAFDGYDKIYLAGVCSDSSNLSSFWAAMKLTQHVTGANKYFTLSPLVYGKIPTSINSLASCITLGKNNDIFIGGRTWDGGESQFMITHVYPFGNKTNSKTLLHKNIFLSLNSSQNELTVHGISNPQFQIDIIDLNGTVVKSSLNTNTLELTSLAKGIYFLRFIGENSNLYTFKFAKL